MRETAKGTFEIAGWDEKTYQELERGGKLSEAKVTQKFTGDIDGEGGVIWLMCYTDPKTAHFVGLQHIVGSVGGRKGSFVIDTDGTFDGSVAKGDWSVIPGSGTGRARGHLGRGSLRGAARSEGDVHDRLRARAVGRPPVRAMARRAS